MRREINGRSLPVSADGICTTSAYSLYSVVVLPNHIWGAIDAKWKRSRVTIEKSNLAFRCSVVDSRRLRRA